MDGCFSIFQGILSTEGSFLDIYLDGLDDHRKFEVQFSEGVDLVQHISSFLTKSTTRLLGLRLLAKCIDNCSIDVLEKKGNLWITLVLKSCNNQELEYNTPIIFDVLSKLIKRSQNVPDLSKSFTSTHICKIYECLTNVPPSKAEYAMSCIETCLRVYPGSSGSSRGVLERLIWKNVDHLDAEVVKSCGKCLHLLQQLKGGGVQGINHKTQWKNYQLQLLSAIHSIYNDMFANCLEMYEEKIEQEPIPWQKEQNDFDPEPVKKAAQMYTRCHNMITYLNIALREPFPVEKPFLIKKILNIIIRGLSVNSTMLEQNPIADNIALSILLPKLHVDLFGLLNTALLILRCHLRPYSELICGLIIDALKWTSVKNNHRDLKPFLVLREKVYNTMSLWCNIMSSGNRSETIAEYLFNEIIRDITPTQSEFTLKVLSGARKHMSKKARRQLHNAQNEQSKMAQTQSNDINRKVFYFEEKNQELCFSALRCLQNILLTVANFIKPTTLKMMHTSIIQICATHYELPPKNNALYSNQNCRIEIYNVLNSILMAPHHLCPPPTEMILNIIQNAYARDGSVKVRAHCSFILKHFEKVIHPQKESLLFTIEAREIRNSFIKLGRENLLSEFGFNFFNAQSDNNVIEVEEQTKISEIVNIPLTANNKSDCVNDNDRIQIINTIVMPEIIAKNENKEMNVLDSDLMESEVLRDKVGIENQLLNTADIADNTLEQTINSNNTDNTPLSPDFILRVDDEGDIYNGDEKETHNEIDKPADEDIVKINAKKKTSGHINDEPCNKKQKLVHDEKNILNVNMEENIGHIDEMETNEDNLLDDIASQFVDELD